MIKIKRLNLMLLLFLVFVPVAFAQLPATIVSYTCDETPVLNHTFNYATDYTANGWTLSTCTFAPDYSPQDNPYLNRSFGVNGSSVNKINCGAGVDFYHQIKRTFATQTTGSILFEFDYIFHNDTDVASSVSRMFAYILKSSVSADGLQITMVQTTPSTLTVSNHAGSTYNIQSCTGTTQLSNETSYKISLLMDIDNKLYSLYINDSVDTGCSNKSLGVGDEFGYLVYAHGYDDEEYSAFESDNFLICETEGVETALDDDVAGAIESVLEDDFNLKTSGSKYFVGVMMLFLISIAFIIGMVQQTHTFTQGMSIGLIFILIFSGMALVYIGLLPMWFAIIITLIGITCFAFLMKNMFSENGG